MLGIDRLSSTLVAMVAAAALSMVGCGSDPASSPLPSGGAAPVGGSGGVAAGGGTAGSGGVPSGGGGSGASGGSGAEGGGEATCVDPGPDPICEATGGSCYYVGPQAGTGSGSYADPFGLDDLPANDTAYCALSSAALEVLQPGDVLYFRAGSYSFATCVSPDMWSVPYIRPARSGQPGAPIVIKAYPGERVELDNASGDQPIIGSDGHDFVHIVGFVLGPHGWLRMSGSDGVVAYNEVIGQYVATGDNHDGIRLEHTTRVWVHHNIVRDVSGDSQNSAGIKLYDTTDSIIEDNYLHGNTAGVFDKDSGIRNTYRRNYFAGNDTELYGNNQGEVSTIYVYDNVLDGPVSLHFLMEGSEVHDNLVRGDTLAGAWAGEVWSSHLWNNVVVSGGASGITAYYENQSDFVEAGASPHLAYMDFNVYDADPSYSFGIYASNTDIFTLAEMQAMGFEVSAAVVGSASEIFVDEVSYELRPAWQTAGRFGDPVGPADVARVLDLTRYGPDACPP